MADAGLAGRPQIASARVTRITASRRNTHSTRVSLSPLRSTIASNGNGRAELHTLPRPVSVSMWYATALDDAAIAEIRALEEAAFLSADLQEGLAAFGEKRPPNFRGA